MSQLVDYGNAHPAFAQTPAWLNGLLKNVGYGVAIADAAGVIQICNSTLQAELRKVGFECSKGSVITDVFRDSMAFSRAVARAQSGACTLIPFQIAGHSTLSIAVGPLHLGGNETGLMITAQRENLCGEYSLWAYGRALGLTPAETSVLQRLSLGLEPARIAKESATAISTIRSQIQAILAKVGAANIRELIIQVGRLPPLPAHSSSDWSKA